jgi:c-di-GMP-binding flagellar brake protein YcgR
MNDFADVFELMPGNTLDVQLNYPVQVRLKLPLVGYSLGQYIIVKYPKVVKESDYKDVLIEGNVAIVRYILEGDKGVCFAFRSTIKNITKHPDKLLFLTYPERIENRQLRLHQRVNTHLPASISLGFNEESEATINGIIVDVSLKGCGFTFKAQSDSVEVNKREVFVCIKQADGSTLRIPSKVCNSRNDKGKVNVGILFTEEDKQVKSLLENLFIDTGAL